MVNDVICMRAGPSTNAEVDRRKNGLTNEMRQLLCWHGKDIILRCNCKPQTTNKMLLGGSRKDNAYMLLVLNSRRAKQKKTLVGLPSTCNVS
jgi:hypothetical protein